MSCSLQRRFRPPSRRLRLECLEDRTVPSLTPVGPEFRASDVTTKTQDSPSVAMDADGNYVVAWDALRGLPNDPAMIDVYARLFDAGRTPRGPEFRVNPITTGSQSHPVVAMDAHGDVIIA